MDTSMDGAMEVSNTVLHAPNPDEQDDLVSENAVDHISNEQTWPTEAELAEAEDRMASAEGDANRKVRVPKGTSSYQAAWAMIAESDDDDNEDNDSDDDMMYEDDDQNTPKEAFELQDGEEYEDVDVDTKTIASYAPQDDLSPEEEDRQYVSPP